MSHNPLLVPVPPQILTERVYEAVKAMLMDQQLEPGSRINIEQLARMLGVSPTPVREALARLESDGLAVKQPLRGYICAPLIDPASFGQLFEMRLLLEPFAAQRAAGLGTDADFDNLAALVVTMRDVPMGASYAEYRTYAQLDAEFHANIALASGNLLLHETLVRLRPHVQLNRLHFHAGPAIDANIEHQAIVTALRLRDADAARNAMREHLEQSCSRLMSAVVAIQPPAARIVRRRRNR